MKNYLNVKFPSKITNVQLSRALLIGFLADLDLPMSTINELKTALSEAVTNAVVHGYNHDETKEIELELMFNDNYIEMSIIDYGVGIENIEAAKEPLFSTKLEEERAGLGFTIMEVFTDQLVIQSTVNQGTKVIMKKHYAI